VKRPRQHLRPSRNRRRPPQAADPGAE
jgi:hypothetical protein